MATAAAPGMAVEDQEQSRVLVVGALGRMGTLVRAAVARAPGHLAVGCHDGHPGRAAVLAAIDALPLKYRSPLVLRHFADLDYDAIGGLLGISRNQVGTLLFRAKRRLRADLGGRTE